MSADEGNRTFVNDGDRINWNKFQVMGEVLTVITKAQTTPYPNLQRNTVVEKLILDAVLNTNDDVSRKQLSSFILMAITDLMQTLPCHV